MSSFEFDLSGGHLALDFTNTFSSTSGEHLNTYADLVDFAHQSGFLTQADAEWLQAEAARDPAPAAGVLNRARHLRQAMRGIFDALANTTEPSESDLDVLNGDLAVSLRHARVVRDKHGFVWGWAGRDFDCTLWPIARAAADLLTSERDRGLVRLCGADDCRWLFLDTSKNRSRQWCSMQSCGNREKARRHYLKLRAARGGQPKRGRSSRTADARRSV